MLRSPHSPPASAACSSLACVCSSIDPPPQADRANVATAATAPIRAPRLRGVLMWVSSSGGWSHMPLVGLRDPGGSRLDDLPVTGEADRQPRVERPARAGSVVAAHVG